MDYDYVIKVKLEPGDIRVCDYCNKFLVDGKAEVVKECHSTEYGLMCNNCIKSIQPITSHKTGACAYSGTCIHLFR